MKYVIYYDPDNPTKFPLRQNLLGIQLPSWAVNVQIMNENGTEFDLKQFLPETVEDVIYTKDELLSYGEESIQRFIISTGTLFHK